MIEYYEVDRLAFNVCSNPINRSGLRVIDDLLDDAYVAMANLIDSGEAEGTDHEASVHGMDASGGFWSRNHVSQFPPMRRRSRYCYNVPAPYSAIMMIERSEDSVRKERPDFQGVFIQPVSEESAIVHRVLAFVVEGRIDEEHLRAELTRTALRSDRALETNRERRLPFGDRQETRAGPSSSGYRSWLIEKGVQYGTSGPHL